MLPSPLLACNGARASPSTSLPNIWWLTSARLWVVALSLLISESSAEGLGATSRQGAERRVSEWAACDGRADDTEALRAALKYANVHSFALIVDCPLRLRIGMDIRKPIYLESNATVRFEKNGKVLVDNVFVPAFAIVNASNITLEGWRVQYDGQMPVDWNVGGYFDGGVWTEAKTYAQPARAFNDISLTQYLMQLHSVKFLKSNSGASRSTWTGPLNLAAIFYLKGTSSNVVFNDTKIYVGQNVGVHQYVPVCFSMNVGQRDNVESAPDTSLNGDIHQIPANIAFHNTELDGYYMGWMGAAQHLIIDKVYARRYGDLEGSDGKNIGGVGKWFAPPHLIYFGNELKGDPRLFVTDVSVQNVIDIGIRGGSARDWDASKLSGYASSLKIGGINISITNYRSFRPDGFLDLLWSDGLTIKDVSSTYNSTFTNGIYPGIRFPANSYRRVLLENISLTDISSEAKVFPIGRIPDGGEGVLIKESKFVVQKWPDTMNAEREIGRRKGVLDNVQFRALH